MKIASHARDIDRVGAGSSTRFTIEAAGKAFEILSSGLYKDKILAIVRELSTNAYDAHVAAGTEATPFKVHLPNALEPHFTIRDFGIGLPDDKLREILTTYFRSTKTDSNEFVGALGLGFKSPFSFVDSFTITSFYNGFRRQYVAFKNADGCPDLDEIGVPELEDGTSPDSWQGEPTEEPNGLEIRVSVDRGPDHREFASRAAQVYEHFEPKPIVTGHANFEPRKVKPVITGHGWLLREVDGHHRDQGEARAIMGRIAYPIVSSSIQDLDPSLRALLTLPIDIEFELGTLEFTAGREELSYDKRLTIPNLKTALGRVRREIQRHVEAEFATCETEYAARTLYANYTSQHRTFSRYWQQARFDIKWKGIAISSSAITIDSSKFEDFQFAEITSYYGNCSYDATIIAPSKKYTRQADIPTDEKLSPFLRNTVVHSREHVSFDCARSITIYVNDLKRGAQGRLKAQASKHGFGRSSWGRVTSALGIVVGDGGAHVQAFLDLLPGATVVRLSDIEAEAAARVRRKAKVRVMNEACIREGTITISKLEERDVDLSQGGFYVITKNGRGTSLPTGSTFDDVWRQVVRHSKLFDPTDKLIVVAPQAVQDQILKSDGKWVDLIKHLSDLANAKIDELLKLPTMERDRSVRELVNSGYRFASGIEQLAQIAAVLKPDHAIAKVIASYRAARKTDREEAVESLERLASTFNRVLPKSTVDFRGEVQAAIAPYSMLKIAVGGQDFQISQRNRQAMRDYVITFDNYRAMMQAELSRTQAEKLRVEAEKISAEQEGKAVSTAIKIVKVDSASNNTEAAA